MKPDHLGGQTLTPYFGPPPPMGSIELRIEETDDRLFQVTWVPTVTYHQSFIIERSLGNDKRFEPIDTVSADTDTYMDTLESEQAYFYRVLAYNPSVVIISNQVWVDQQ